MIEKQWGEKQDQRRKRSMMEQICPVPLEEASLKKQRKIMRIRTNRNKLLRTDYPPLCITSVLS